MVAIGAIVLGACGSAGDDAEQAAPSPIAAETSVPESSAAPDTTPESSAAPDTTQPMADDETGGTPVADALDPAGSAAGGSTGRSYPGEEFPAELTGIIGAAADDLAGRLGIDSSSVKVVLVEEVVWSDTSLGCPQPGMSYAQVLTDGMRIVLEAEGALYDYRSGGQRDPFLCVQAPATDKSSAGLYEISEDGVTQVEPPTYDEKAPTEGTNPPDD